MEAPNDLLARWIASAPQGRALDLGAGDGAAAAWLAAQGYAVDAVERAPGASVELQRQADGPPAIQVHQADLRSFPLEKDRYALIHAGAVLHFLRPTELWTLVEPLIESLAPKGLLLAEVFTTDDPGFDVLCSEGARQVEPNTFLAPEPVGLIHYFAPGELRRLFAGLTVLEYEEYRRLDPTSEGGYRAGASLVGRRDPEV